VVVYIILTLDVDTQANDVDGMLQRPDIAVRATKGGERVRGYVPSMGQIFLRRFQMVMQFRQAIEDGHITVHYQPKVALPSRQIRGVEALVRWQHPEFGKLNPDEFVPAIEAAGLVGVLTDFVLEQALRRVRSWLDEGFRVSAAVNLSVRNLSAEQFPTRVAQALYTFDVPAELFRCELTETGGMPDRER